MHVKGYGIIWRVVVNSHPDQWAYFLCTACARFDIKQVSFLPVILHECMLMKSDTSYRRQVTKQVVFHLRMSASKSFSRWCQLVETLSFSPCRKTECTWSLSQLWRNSAEREKRLSLVIEEIGREKKKSRTETPSNVRFTAWNCFLQSFRHNAIFLHLSQPLAVIVVQVTLTDACAHIMSWFSLPHLTLCFFLYFCDCTYSDSLSPWGGLGRNISKIASQHTKAVRHLHIVRTV